MNYNMNNNTVLIEKYIDGQSSAEENLFVESMIAGDADFREEYEYMKLAVSSVRLSAVHTQVSEAANAYFEEISAKAKNPTAMIRSIGYYSMRAAAVLIVIAASYTAIIYATTTPEKLYSEAFTDYNLETVRGTASASAIEQEYRMGRWQHVIAELADIKSLSPKEMLLGGIAALHLNDPSRAQHFFQGIIDNTNTLSTGSFREESEFYLALTYIKLNKPQTAVKLLSAIKNNPHHLYYSQVNRISALELSMFGWKN
jgi:hypothetical protein